jgi:hypothetical protein
MNMEAEKLTVLALIFFTLVLLAIMMLVTPFHYTLILESRAVLGQEMIDFLYTYRGLDLTTVTFMIFVAIASCVAMLRE